MTITEKLNTHIRRLAFSAMFLALALVLPFLTGQVPQIGSMLCPMHLPVLLCGFICGWPWGLVVGFIAPLLRSAIFGMPGPATAIPMAFELAVYGCASGLLHHLLPKKTWVIYISLISAMILGRLAWGAASLVLAGINGTTFTLSVFFAGAVANAVPGIILQLVLIPLIVAAMERAKLTLN